MNMPKLTMIASKNDGKLHVDMECCNSREHFQQLLSAVIEMAEFYLEENDLERLPISMNDITSSITEIR